LKKIVEFDLKYSIPDGIGLQFSGYGRNKEFLESDIPKILESIFLKIEKEKNGSEKVDLRVKGSASPVILMMLTAGIARRPDVNNFYFTTMHGLPVRICSTGEVTN
jgi:hypothetical protein